MISPLLVSALLMAAGRDPADARNAYMSCLRGYVRTSVDKKLSITDFQTGLSGTCKDQEEAYRKAAVDYDVSRGIARRTSEQGVSDELSDMLTEQKERFADEVQAAGPSPN
jgi:hypothetical protein